MKKRLPKKNEKDFNEFFEKTDFGDYLEPKDIKKMKFELKPKDKLISLRVSSEFLMLLKKAAKKNHTKYQKLIRSILEDNISRYF